MRILLTKRFLAATGKLSPEERAAVDTALSALLATYGRPHVHIGTSVRPLIPPVYELRASRALRRAPHIAKHPHRLRPQTRRTGNGLRGEP